MARDDRDSAESVASNIGSGLRVDENDALNAYTYADDVKAVIESYGLSRRERPRVTGFQEGLTDLKAGQYFDGRLPPVLIRLSLDQLSALYSLFTAWYGYVMATLHSVMIERSEAKRQREFLLSMIRQQHKLDHERLDAAGNAKKRPTQEMSDMAKLDARFVNADAKYEQLNMLYQYLEAMAQVTEQDMRMISREITIQQIKIEAEFKRRGLLSGAVNMSDVSTRSFKDRQERDDEPEASTPEDPPARQIVRRQVPAVQKSAAASAVPSKARRGIRIQK